ncbi:MAG: 2-oxo acid dehydrogenase subunit E2 [Terricaulis sp.]
MADTLNIIAPLEQEGSKSVVRAWLKKVGDRVRRDEPLLELETDKVAVEVPAPADGVLAEIALNEGDEAAPGAVLGVLSTSQSGPPAPPPASAAPAGDGAGGPDLRQRLSPLVKRLLSEHKLAPGEIAGTGCDGRITHKDVEAFLGARAHGPTRIPHGAMRKSIAEHMARSVRTAPHVTAVFEANFSAIAAHRAMHKAAYEKAGAPLTYSSYIVRAAAVAMASSPNVNARWHEDFLEVFTDVNIGIGVALGEKGLIVPVIQRAQILTLRETATELGDFTERARGNQLKPSDVRGGTFTISNHGVSGSLLAAPIIINQPQSAILGVGKLEKRVVVRTIGGADTMVIKPMAYVSLTIDHRVLDGHQTNLWLTRFVETLEAWPLEDEA